MLVSPTLILKREKNFFFSWLLTFWGHLGDIWFWTCVGMCKHGWALCLNWIFSRNHQFVLNLKTSFLKYTGCSQKQCFVWVQKRYFSYARFLVVISWSESKILMEERGKCEQSFCCCCCIVGGAVIFASIFPGSFLLLQLMLIRGFIEVFLVMSYSLQKLTKVLLSSWALKAWHTVWGG